MSDKTNTSGGGIGSPCAPTDRSWATTDTRACESVIVMTRVYDAPRDLVWEAITDPKHVARWWGGRGVTNPVCEMDLRPGGRWRHVMRFPDGRELHMSFLFVEIDKPRKLVWQSVGSQGVGDILFTATLDDTPNPNKTAWKLTAHFRSEQDRDTALSMGFTKPIEASNDRFADYLETLKTQGIHPPMNISMYTMAVDSFVPMLEGLSEILDKGAAYAAPNNVDLVKARLAPDMYTLAKQIHLACHFAADTTSRLTGHPARQVAETTAQPETLDTLKRLIATAIKEIKETPEAAFAGAEDRECNIPVPNGMVIEMNGLQFLRSWALPHFYFHVVTAYDILRHEGVSIGKQDYLSQVGRFIRPPR